MFFGEPRYGMQEPQNVALTIQEARQYFRPPLSIQTVYRLIWSGKIRVLDQPGVIRIPLSELQKFFGRVKVYTPSKTRSKAVKKVRAARKREAAELGAKPELVS